MNPMPLDDRDPAPRPSRPFGAVLALAAVVLAVAVYIGWFRSETPHKPDNPTGTSLAQDVIIRAKSLAAAGQTAPAIELMQSYVRTRLGDVEVRPALARILWSAGRIDEAGRVLDEIQRIAPNLAPALWLRGEMAKARGEADYAKHFAQAVASPTVEPPMLSLYALELLASGEDAEAQAFLTRAQAAGLKDVPTHQGMGLLALRRKQYAQAAEQFREALKIDRASAACWRMLAVAQREDGQVEQALQTLQDALKATRDRAGLYLETGRTLALLRRPSDAAQAFAAAADPSVLPTQDRVEAAVEAAIGYYRSGRYALAMKYVDLALSLAPGDARAREWVSRIEDARFAPASAPASRENRD